MLRAALLMFALSGCSLLAVDVELHHVSAELEPDVEIGVVVTDLAEGGDVDRRIAGDSLGELVGVAVEVVPAVDVEGDEGERQDAHPRPDARAHQVRAAAGMHPEPAERPEHQRGVCPVRDPRIDHEAEATHALGTSREGAAQQRHENQHLADDLHIELGRPPGGLIEI